MNERHEPSPADDVRLPENAFRPLSPGERYEPRADGCFASDGFRTAFLNGLDAPSSDLAFATLIDATLDDLARHLAKHVDLERLLGMAQLVAS